MEEFVFKLNDQIKLDKKVTQRKVIKRMSKKAGKKIFLPKIDQEKNARTSFFHSSLPPPPDQVDRPYVITSFEL